MKFSALLIALTALVATSQVAATTESSVHVRIRVHKPADTEVRAEPGAICYKQCPTGQHCARGTTTCRGPKNGSTECFNPATSIFIAKCDRGFKCVSGKCVFGSDGTDAGNAAGAICYKQCPTGQHCARGTTTCRAPKAGTTECFNPAMSLWISKCDPGFKCVNGKCAYAHQKAIAIEVEEADEGAEDEEDSDSETAEDDVEMRSNPGAICYKQCPTGQHCARGTTTCRAPKAGTTECFNPATSLFIAKCDPGFKCSSGKCVYAH